MHGESYSITSVGGTYSFRQKLHFHLFPSHNHRMDTANQGIFQVEWVNTCFFLKKLCTPHTAPHVLHLHSAARGWARLTRHQRHLGGEASVEMWEEPGSIQKCVVFQSCVRVNSYQVPAKIIHLAVARHLPGASCWSCWFIPGFWYVGSKSNELPPSGASLKIFEQSDTEALDPHSTPPTPTSPPTKKQQLQTAHRMAPEWMIKSVVLLLWHIFNIINFGSSTGVTPCMLL